MSHNHSHHHHHHAPANYNWAFAWGVGLNTVYIVVEAVFGFLAGSLALLADAGHNLSDVLGLLLAWGAHYLSRWPATSRRTYGFRSSSILAALFNALILLVAIGGIIWEAIRRFNTPAEIEGTTIMWVAGIGVVINTVTALLFLRGGERDLNIRGAFLHMAADAGISLGVVLAGLGIWLTGQLWIDPVVSLVVAVIIFYGTWDLLKESINLAMHAVPREIDPQQVRSYLEELPGVTAVHDLHIWAMSTTETALTAHLVRPSANDDDTLLAEVAAHLHDEYHIEHTTVQIERCAEAARCRQAADEAV